MLEQEARAALISIHALCEEGDRINQWLDTGDNKFLSTPSARRATDAALGDSEAAKFLSTPSARRATYETALESPKEDISIHALCEEGDESQER